MWLILVGKWPSWGCPPVCPIDGPPTDQGQNVGPQVRTEGRAGYACTFSFCACWSCPCREGRLMGGERKPSFPVKRLFFFFKKKDTQRGCIFSWGHTASWQQIFVLGYRGQSVWIERAWFWSWLGLMFTFYLCDLSLRQICPMVLKFAPNVLLGGLHEI